MNYPFISCLCPTYKRPELLKNVIACFEAQDYPKDRCELIIFDDAQQFDEQYGQNWHLKPIATSYASLPQKFNSMIEEAKGEIITIWEDDDIFLPTNLNEVAIAHQQGGSEFYICKNVWNTYQQKQGEVQLTDASGIYHSSWRFSRNLIDRIGGYPNTEELSFDQQLGELLRSNANGVLNYGKEHSPSYVYRWGNGYWHGSQSGDGKGYRDLWEYVGNLPMEKQEKIIPRFDLETQKIFDFLKSKI